MVKWYKWRYVGCVLESTQEWELNVEGSKEKALGLYKGTQYIKGGKEASPDA